MPLLHCSNQSGSNPSSAVVNPQQPRLSGSLLSPSAAALPTNGGPSNVGIIMSPRVSHHTTTAADGATVHTGNHPVPLSLQRLHFLSSLMSSATTNLFSCAGTLLLTVIDTALSLPIAFKCAVWLFIILGGMLLSVCAMFDVFGLLVTGAGPQKGTASHTFAVIHAFVLPLIGFGGFFLFIPPLSQPFLSYRALSSFRRGFSSEVTSESASNTGGGAPIEEMNASANITSASACTFPPVTTIVTCSSDIAAEVNCVSSNSLGSRGSHSNMLHNHTSITVAGVSSAARGGGPLPSTAASPPMAAYHNKTVNSLDGDEKEAGAEEDDLCVVIGSVCVAVKALASEAAAGAGGGQGAVSNGRGRGWGAVVAPIHLLIVFTFYKMKRAFLQTIGIGYATKGLFMMMPLSALLMALGLAYGPSYYHKACSIVYPAEWVENYYDKEARDDYHTKDKHDTDKQIIRRERHFSQQGSSSANGGEASLGLKQQSFQPATTADRDWVNAEGSVYIINIMNARTSLLRRGDPPISSAVIGASVGNNRIAAEDGGEGVAEEARFYSNDQRLVSQSRFTPLREEEARERLKRDSAERKHRALAQPFLPALRPIKKLHEKFQSKLKRILSGKGSPSATEEKARHFGIMEQLIVQHEEQHGDEAGGHGVNNNNAAVGAEGGIPPRHHVPVLPIEDKSTAAKVFYPYLFVRFRGPLVPSGDAHFHLWFCVFDVLAAIVLMLQYIGHYQLHKHK